MIPGDLAVLDEGSGEVYLRPRAGGWGGARRLRHGEVVLVLRQWNGSDYDRSTDAWKGDVEVLTPWGVRGWVLESRLRSV